MSLIQQKNENFLLLYMMRSRFATFVFILLLTTQKYQLKRTRYYSLNSIQYYVVKLFNLRTFLYILENIFVFKQKIQPIKKLQNISSIKII